MGQRVFKVGDRVTNIKQVGNTCVGEACGVVVGLYDSSYYFCPVQVKIDKHGKTRAFRHDELDHEKNYIVQQIIDDL